jgi:hypothetical protein
VGGIEILRVGLGCVKLRSDKGGARRLRVEKQLDSFQDRVVVFSASLSTSSKLLRRGNSTSLDLLVPSLTIWIRIGLSIAL